MILPVWRVAGRRAALALGLILGSIVALCPEVRADQASVVTPVTGPHSMTDFTTNFLNPALRALLSCSSGAAAPANGPSNAPVAGQCWLDTSAAPMTYRIYDGAQWLSWATIDATGHIVSLPSPTFTGTPKTPALTGYLYGNGGGGWTASPSLPTTVLTGPLQAAQVPAFTGDVAIAAGTQTTTINPGAVTSAKMAAGAAAGNLGTTAGGDVSGPYGALVINPGVVTSAKMAAGAALGNLATNSVDATKMVQAPAGTIRGNLTGATANVSDATLKAYMAAALGTTPGQMLCYDSTNGWTTVPASTSASQVLTYGAAGSCPSPQSPTAASAAPRSSVRQTVQGGPQSGGLPTFLPATSSSLSLTAQNVSTGVNAMTIAAAQGFNTTGPNDVVTQLTSNPTWSGLTASTTNYLYVNASSGATSSNTLAPIILEPGDTPSVAANQFSFDRFKMIGYLGNGSAAVPTPIVAVGEADTSSSGVTATRAYAYNGVYDSGWTAGLGSPASTYTVSHNLGIAPDAIRTAQFIIQNKTAELGYSVGDTVFYVGSHNGTYLISGSPILNRLTATFVTTAGGSGSGLALSHKSTGVANYLTPANWRWKIVVARPW